MLMRGIHPQAFYQNTRVVIMVELTSDPTASGGEVMEVCTHHTGPKLVGHCASVPSRYTLKQTHVLRYIHAGRPEDGDEQVSLYSIGAIGRAQEHYRVGHPDSLMTERADEVNESQKTEWK